MSENSCSFFGCQQPVCKDDADSTDAMKFCQQHHDEIMGYVTATPFLPGKVLNFWVRAQGTAEAAAKRIFG